MGNTKDKTTNRLINAFKNNDENAMQQVYHDTFSKFQRHVLKNSGNESQAKDVFQEAFISCWRNIKEEKLAANGNVEAYLFAIAKNKWIDYLRSSDFRKTLKTGDFNHLTKVPDESDEEEDAALEQQRSILRQAIEKLGDQCKTLLLRFYFERQPMEEISKTMDITPASARNQKYRCMKKLRDLSLKLQSNG
ncbi:MAG: RNA polymerase sigma factor [Bacteroidota bacterium]